MTAAELLLALLLGAAVALWAQILWPLAVAVPAALAGLVEGLWLIIKAAVVRRG